MRERHGRVLAELAETGMVMVRRLSEAMLRTDDVQTRAQLGLAYHRVSRAVRQTMALEFRLMQEPRDIAPARPAPPPEPRPAAPPRLRAERTGWDEYERDDSNEAFEDLDALLDAEHLDLDAAHEAVETCIAHIRRDLDVDPTLTARLSSSLSGGGPAEGRWRGKPAGEACPGNPLHPAAQGPPPPTGKEKGPLDAALGYRSASNPAGRRSQLLGGAASARPRLATPRPPAPAWRSSA